MAHSRSHLAFDGSDYELSQHAAVASVARRFGERFTLRLSAGAVLDGQLHGEGFVYDIEPGPLLSLGGAYRLFGPPSDLHFVTLSLAYGMSFAESEDRATGERERFTASDARFGVMAGITLWERVSPYVAGRVFGGPVGLKQRGRERTGSDRGKVAVGIGVGSSVGRGVTLTTEAMMLGERSAALGVDVALP